MLPYVILGKTDIKLLFGNSGSNEENNCKSDHNRSELLCHWLVKYRCPKIGVQTTYYFFLQTIFFPLKMINVAFGDLQH
jgi:hypothetical protein